MGIDIRLGAGVPLAWLKGPSPQLPKQAFMAKWGKLVQQRDGTPLVNISTASLAAPATPAAGAAAAAAELEA